MAPGPHGLTLAAALGATAVGYATGGTPALVAAGACAAVAARPAWRRWRRHRVFIAPTVKVVSGQVGDGRVELKVRGPLARPPRRMRRLELPLRRAYTAHVEPVVRWLPDRAMRAWWTVARPADRALDWLRLIDPPRVTLTIRGMERPYLDDDTRLKIQAVIKAKLPVGDVLPAWSQIGSTPTATWTQRKRPPAKVGLAELEAVFGRLADHEFFAGLDAAGKPYIVSLEDDSPHIACSAGSGAGKSVLAMLLAVQVLRRGGRVVILDRKGSHRWAKDLESVTYCLKPEQMHHALIRLGGDAWGNNDTAFHSNDDGWTPDDRVLVIAEELNATFSWLRRYWSEHGVKGEPSPAVIAFQDLLYTGRSAHHHVFAVAQMLTANTVGGPEARENFGVRALARYSANNWKMLCAGVAMPRPSRTRGRWQFVTGGEATEVQVAFLDRAQACAFAGVPSRKSGGSYGSPTSTVTGHGQETGNEAEPISIAQALDEGVLPWPSKAAVKMRLQRARSEGRPVPEPSGRRGLQTLLYRREDLAAWAKSELERAA